MLPNPTHNPRPYPCNAHTPIAAAEEIPPNFLKACKGNVEKAGRKWLASKQWREENDIGVRNTCAHVYACVGDLG
jgi:hypothetical protein